jgi:N4-(beta-N-acetylglucosaminyl)-L-asparaginase
MTTFLSTWREPGQTAIETAWTARAAGGDLLTCLERGLAACEEDPQFLAIGRGSLPNCDGELELDAAIMDGADLSAGAVCGVRGILPVISLARRVKERTPHVMLCGEQARRFAVQQGFRPQNLMTAANVERFDAWKEDPLAYDKEYVHTVDDHHGDTVTMLGFEGPSHFVAASSTSGIAWKLPGRVGDSPIVGAGIYADDEVGCAGATGWGEELWKCVASFRTVEAMRHGLSAQEACEQTARQMMRRQPFSREKPCVVLALDREGGVGAATTEGVFPLWICRDGEMELREIPAIQL